MVLVDFDGRSKENETNVATLNTPTVTVLATSQVISWSNSHPVGDDKWVLGREGEGRNVAEELLTRFIYCTIATKCSQGDM
jgi:hypothetical protein